MHLINLIDLRSCALIALLSVVPYAATATIVAIDLDLPIDQTAPDMKGIKVGDHHHARVFYDTSKVNPKTHRVQPLHMQHLVFGHWIPERLDPVSMPMADSWLDLGTSPYTYHYHSVQGDTSIDFDDQTHRLSIRHTADSSLVLGAPYVVDPTPVKDPGVYTLKAPPPKYVMYNVEVRLDQLSAGGTSKVGDVDKVRVIYDASLVDPRTHHAQLVNFQHYVRSNYFPAHADPIAMPTGDAWIDLSHKPYAIHFHAAVTHGMPIVINVDEKSRRLSISSQSEPDKVMMGGTYVVDPTPNSGAEVDMAAKPMPPEAKPAPSEAQRP